MKSERIILAGGCFWGMEDLIRSHSGVTATQVGYTGGNFKDPTYKDVCKGDTGHAEAIEVTFSPEQINLTTLLQYFFQIHDPTTLNRQGNDRGNQYRSAIYYTNEDQKQVAETLVQAMELSGKWPGKIVTTVEPADVFYPAEDYHQHYLQKNPGGYTCHWVRSGWTVENYF